MARSPRRTPAASSAMLKGKRFDLEFIRGPRLCGELGREATARQAPRAGLPIAYFLKLRMSGFRTIESSCSCPGPLLQCTANAARGGGRAMELTPLATIALIACAVVLIYAFVWWLTRTISRRVRAVVRSAVVLIT